MFGMALLSSFSTQPFWTSSAGYGELSVSTMMSRPIDWPRASGAWIFPKKPALSLMSSMYLTLMPVFFCELRRCVGCRFLLLVDVERPVGDGACLELGCRRAANERCRRGRRRPRQCERSAAGGGAAQELLAGRGCALHDSTSGGSTTNAAFGLERERQALARAAPLSAGLRVLDVDGRDGRVRSSTTYCVETPT